MALCWAVNAEGQERNCAAEFPNDVVSLCGVCAHWLREPAFVAEDYLYLEDRYAVTIRRDTRGVPHVLVRSMLMVPSVLLMPKTIGN